MRRCCRRQWVARLLRERPAGASRRSRSVSKALLAPSRSPRNRVWPSRGPREPILSQFGVDFGTILGPKIVPRWVPRGYHQKAKNIEKNTWFLMFFKVPGGPGGVQNLSQNGFKIRSQLDGQKTSKNDPTWRHLGAILGPCWCQDGPKRDQNHNRKQKRKYNKIL